MERNKKAAAEAVWLHYFNQYLYEHGMITETMRDRASIRINSREK